MRTSELLPNQREFRAHVRAFVQSYLLPRGEAWEKAENVPFSAFRRCASEGLISMDRERNAIVAEEIPRCESLGFALSIFVQSNLIAPMLDQLGTASQKATFLVHLLQGRKLGAMAVSEPSTGSDFGALETHAKKTRNGWRITGVKTYITNAALAQFLIVAARTEPSEDMQGISFFLVPVESTGLSVKRLPMLGLRTSAAGEVTLDRCEVPSGNLLGEPGEAFGYIQSGLSRERLFGGLACVSWAQHALDKTVQYVRNRRAFGSSLNRFQAIRHRIAEMHTHLAAARQLNYGTFSRWLAGEQVTNEICTIKLFSYQTAQDVITGCLQLHGGLGYTENHWCSRFYRDARALTIAAGTPEIMKEMIAAYLRL
jgi:acyl-CoA dehydrogenase